MTQQQRYVGLTAQQHEALGCILMFIGSLGFQLAIARYLAWFGIACIVASWMCRRKT